MITPELPPLPNPPLEYRHEGCTYIDRESFLEWRDQHSARERIRILLARVAANDDALSWVGELLAVMHADGGHYLAKHGMEKAIGDAMDKYHAMHLRISDLEADAERRNMLRNADRTRSRCYHFVVSLGELGICGNEQAAAAFMATAKEMRVPHVGRKQIKRIAQEASGGVFGNHDDPYVDAEARDAARGAK